MGCELLMSGTQTLSTELESLMYTFFHAATAGKLYWQHFPDRAALDPKMSTMLCRDLFEERVSWKIENEGLRRKARALRSLFFSGGEYSTEVMAPSFCLALDK